MEDHRFDNVARSLGGGTTRRGVLRLLAAGAAGGFSAMTGAGAKAAPGGGKGKPPCCPTGYDAICTVDERPTCTNTRTDASNCGACGASCPSGVCTNGVCSTTVCVPGSTGASCTAGIGVCQRTGSLVCKPDGSGYACDAVPGEPQEEICNGLDDDCDGSVDEDFNFLADVNHCGECNHECQAPNATPVCLNGVCSFVNCHAGYADCDGRADNGCETNTTNDVGGCGSCDNVCTFPPANGTVACVNSECIVTCEPGYHVAGSSNQPECVADAGCTVNHGGCHPVATCTDTDGGPVCQCPAGYTGDGVGEQGCIDVDECATNNGGCSPDATCTDIGGGRLCACNDGFTGDGVTCTPVVPGLASVSVSPNPLPMGIAGTGIVTLDDAAVGNTTVTLSSSNANLIVDATAVVPDGHTSGTFGVRWVAADDSIATVSATLGGQTVTTAVSFTFS